MTRSTIQALALEGVDITEAIEDELAIPASWYSSAAAHEFETEAIFENTWSLAAPEALFSETGSRVILQLGRVPVVLVRDAEGTINGFVNVCPHRGYIVACDEHRRNTLQCGYHAWTFNLDGSLRRAPRTENEPRFDPGKAGLQPISVEVRHGLVFANADPDAMPFDEFFPDFEDAAAAMGLATENYRYVGRTQIEVPANWKLWVENGRECYHCSTVHSTSLQTELTGDVDEFLFTNVAVDHNPSQDGKWAATSLQIFPSGMVVQDAYILKIGVTVPTGPGTSTFIAYNFHHRDRTDEEAQAMMDVWEHTFAEDAAAVSVQQRGLASGRIARAQLQPLNEKMTAQQHKLTWEAYRRGLQRPVT